MADLFLGIDIGTGGVRACAVDAGGSIRGLASVALPPPVQHGNAIDQEPELWWQATVSAIRKLGEIIDLTRIDRIAIDGTSGTLLLIDAAGRPCSLGLICNDARAIAAAERIADIVPKESGAHGRSSALAKLLHLQSRGEAKNARHAVHQADWIAGRLGGYHVAAGTTDGVAAFIATGAHQPGDAVTSLGTTLVVKLLATEPIFAPDLGIYSHRLGDRWLVGGASNSGGAALLKHFTVQEMESMTPELRPTEPTGLDYYPLPKPGERFPITDPTLPARLTPRPAENHVFFLGLLEGIASVEARAYRHLALLGAPCIPLSFIPQVEQRALTAAKLACRP